MGFDGLAFAIVIVHASAGPSQLAIEWEAPAACPDAAEVRARVAALGVEVRDTARLRARIDASGAGLFRLSMTLATSVGETTRTIDAASCDLLADSAAVVVAVALDPLATIDDVHSAVTTTVPPPSIATLPDGEAASAPVVTPGTPADRPAVAIRRRSRPRWILGARALVGRGTLATIDVGGEAIVALAWPHARLELGGLALAPRPARYPDRPDVGVDVGVAAALVRGCAALGPDRIQLELCGGVALGAAFARGVGVRVPRTAGSPWLAFDVGPRLVVRPHPRVGVVVGLGAVLGATRPAFSIAERDDAAYRLRSAAIRATIGLETRWP